MKLYVLSDVHYDFYAPPSSAKKYFERHCLPADVLVCAGDVANTFDAYARFVEEISARYKDVVLCLGNHDITVRFDKGRFSTSEEKIRAIKELCGRAGNVHLLDGNCVEIGGVKFGGCMGMWDYSFLAQSAIYDEIFEGMVQADYGWKNFWFDGQNWDYFGNSIKKIREAENEKLSAIMAQKPDVVLTHFCPLVPQDKMPSRFRHDYFSTYFYFDRKIAEKYLAENQGALWCTGHTHTAYKDNGILVHPAGYPEENPLKFDALTKEDFLLEVRP